MPTTRSVILPSRMVRALLTLAITAPATVHAAEQYAIYAAGLYDSSSTVGSHLALNGVNGNSISYFNNAGALAGSATRYTSNTYSPPTDGSSGITAGNNVWYYDPTSHNTYTIGFTGDAYTRSVAGDMYSPAGTQFSRLYGMDNQGDVAGTSTQFLGNASVGTTAWVYTAPTVANPSGVTTAIRLAPTADGLVVYTLANGTTNSNGTAESSYLNGMNASGQVVGTSTRYDSLTYSNEGASAWIYSGGVTTNVGLTGPAYTGSDGEMQISTVAGINANGQVVGTSTNFARGSGLQDVYFYDPSTGSKAIGLTGIPTTDPNYALSANYIGSYTQLAPTTGAAAGYSITTSFGDTAWVYNIAAAKTTVVSLTGTTVPTLGANATYLNSSGTGTDQYSSISALNASGQAIGIQGIYATATGVLGAPTGSSIGYDAFVFNGNTTIAIGLTDSTHTANPAIANSNTNGHGTIYTSRTNTPSFINNAGQVVGTAARYTASYFGSVGAIGQDAWFYAPGITPDANGNNAITIGLATSTTPGFSTTPYTTVSSNRLTTGTRNTYVVGMNASGLVAGYSARYFSNGTSSGYDAFAYTPGGTSVRIGLVDSVHSYGTGTAAVENDVASAINDAGLIAGTATRYTTTGATNGQDVWLFDSITNTTYTINLSTTNDGLANATITSLSANGLLLGSYNKYNPTTDALLGTYAYAFTEKTGAYDLGINTTNLTSAGWQQLASALSSDTRGDIDGYGILDTAAYPGGINTAYVLQHLLLGDANGDGKVDLSDLNIVLNNLGTTTSLRSNGNFDGAPTIDLTDLNDVLNNLGTSLPGSSAVIGATAAVPEPASLGLLAAGGLFLIHRKCRRASRGILGA